MVRHILHGCTGGMIDPLLDTSWHASCCETINSTPHLTERTVVRLPGPQEPCHVSAPNCAFFLASAHPALYNINTTKGGRHGLRNFDNWIRGVCSVAGHGAREGRLMMFFIAGFVLGCLIGATVFEDAARSWGLR